MSGKRLTFNTSTGNNQGFKIPNDVINFDRFIKNPVLLKQHDWESLPLGKATDLKYENGKWSFIPVFHRLTPESNQYADLYEAGYLNGCSMGGFKALKTTGRTIVDSEGKRIPETYLDADGDGVAASFDLYEISMVTIPSLADAVAEETLLAAKCYDEINITSIETELTKLTAKIQNMETEAEKAQRLEKEQAEQLKAAKLKAEQEEADKLKAADALPEPIASAVKKEEAKRKAGLSALFDYLFGGNGNEQDKPAPNTVLNSPPEIKGLYTVEDSKKADDRLFGKLQDQNMPNIADAKNEKSDRLKAAQLKASKLIETALAAKEKAEMESATEEDKEEFMAAKKKAEEAVELCSNLEAEMEDDEDYMTAKAKEQLAARKPVIKTMDELKEAKVKLAAKPNLGYANVFGTRLPKSMAALAADPNGKKIIERVQNRDESAMTQDYGVYMSAMRNDPKYKAVFDRTNIVYNADPTRLHSYRQRGDQKIGYQVDEIIAKLAAGRVSWLTKDNVVVEADATKLTATDNFLASPDLFAMDFLDLAIFQLFPTTSWKNDIPIFGAQSTEQNTGIIWANIAANPTIYMGTQPTNPTSYVYTDTAVSLNLTPFWLQPMLWTPLTMAQLRYDQMGTGWAQAFAVLGTYIDDWLLYTLASTVPHSSIQYTSGVSPNPNGGNSAVQQFTLNGNADSPYSFYYNPLFAGSLNNPTLNDIIALETVYNKQNYNLAAEKAVLVIDPTTDSLITQTGQAQTLLLRWTEANQEDQLGFKHTKFNLRSRVVAFDPTTAQVKNPFSAIPNSATSANLGFIPSQVGIGIGNLDVFMIQSPSEYGYKMSADVRMGIVPLRANFNGTTILAYGPQKIS